MDGHIRSGAKKSGGRKHTHIYSLAAGSKDSGTERHRLVWLKEGTLIVLTVAATDGQDM
jgi:hypothetical protein